MTRVILECEELFDGVGWHGPSEIVIESGDIACVRHAGEPGACSTSEALRVNTVIPGLVDFGVSASGYAETPSPIDPFLPERAFARMSLRYGITTLVDVNNSSGPLSYLETLGDLGEGPRLFHSGGRLASRPTGRHDIMVTRDNLDRCLAAVVQSGATLLSLGMCEPEIASRVERWAIEAGIPLTISSQIAPEVPGLQTICGGGNGSDEEGARSRLYVAPQLNASAHWTVRGILDAPNGHFASPVLPHCRNFLRGRGRIGRRVAEPIVGRYYPNRDERLLDPRIEDVAKAALVRRECVASSSAGTTGMVPGLSLWSELDRLASLAESRATVLAAATSVPAEVMAMSRGGRSIGMVAAGFSADLLVTRGGSTASPVDLLRGLSMVVRAGQMLEVSDLADEVDDMIAKALRGEL